MRAKWLKRLGIALGVLGLLGFALVAFIFTRLPSPSDLGRAMRVARATSPSPTPSSHGPSPGPSLSADNVAKLAEQRQQQESVNDYVLTRYLTSERPVRVEVCEHLDLARDSESNGSGFTAQLQLIASGRKSADPLVESVLAPLGYALVMPSMQELIREAKAAGERNEESFTQKADFYSKVLTVAADYVRRTPEIERVADRAYLLHTIVKLVRENPSLANDPRTRAVCDAIQTHVLDTATDPSADRAALANYLTALGVRAESVGYDPNYRTRLEVVQGKESLRLKIGWLDEMLGETTEERAQ